GLITRFDGQLMHLGAVVGPNTDAAERYRRLFPRPPDREMVIGRALLDRTVGHFADVEQAESHQGRGTGRDFGFRRGLIVPLLREGEAIGTLNVVGREPGLYTDGQLSLLQTFADQAVIAIENVRLFKELQEKNHALTQAHAQVTQSLEQQTATSEILRVIASSPTDLQPGFDTIAENAGRLCGATDATIRRIEGNALRLVARFGSIPFVAPDVIPSGRDYLTGLPVIEGRPIHIEAILPRLETEFPTISRELRTVLATPLLREGVPIGAIVIRRAEVQPFTDAQVALLQTFADQAVIAIENVRLFTELPGKNRALTAAHAQTNDALKQPTATSEILRVISQSPTDVQPVFDVILASATRLCTAELGVLWLYEGTDLFRPVAFHGVSPQYRSWLSSGAHRVPPP